MADMTREIEGCVARLQESFGSGVLCDVVPLAGCSLELAPEEQALVARAVPERRREFAAGRACARRLLERLGFAPAPLLRANDRVPLWPRGAIGSITHSRSHCAVAVARTGRLAALGLDTELDEPLELDLWSSICTPCELETLSRCAPDARGKSARLRFSAKECAYKCLYPSTRAALEFRDVEIEFDSWRNSFRASVRHAAIRPRANIVIEGFHLACAGSIFTGAALPAA
jgi:4'-phosphopantetheinyl transferase EntD